MAEPGPSSAAPLEDVLEVFSSREDSAEPLTAPEVADALGADRRTVFNRLRELRDRGDLASKKTGARGRVWWIPNVESDAPAAPLKRLVGMLDEDEADRAEQRQREWREGFDREIRGDDAPERGA